MAVHDHPPRAKGTRHMGNDSARFPDIHGNESEGALWCSRGTDGHVSHNSGEIRQEITNALEGLVVKLKDDLRKIKESLGMEPPDKPSARLIYAIWGDDNLRELLVQTETRSGELLSWLLILDLGVYRQNPASVTALKREVLRGEGEKTETKISIGSTPCASSPRLYAVKAQYKPPGGKISNILVLVETFHAPIEDGENDKIDAIQTIATLLGRGIGSSSGGCATGILPCLGYQKKNVPEKGTEEIALMFRLPEKVDLPKTLRATIARDMDNGGVASLERRFDLARQLADTVFRLHTASLLHKNIRSDTIFLLEAVDGTKTVDILKSLLADDAVDNDANAPVPAEKSSSGFIKRIARSLSSTRRKNTNKMSHSEARTSRKKSPDPGPERNARRTEAKGSPSRKKNELIHGKQEERGRPTSPRRATGATEGATRTQIQQPGQRGQWLVPGSTIAILTHWSDAKKTDGTSTTSGPSQNDWSIKVYRNPRQQSEENNDEYHFGHDIYALGVCLLEIGLWECLVYPSKTSIPGTTPVASQLLVSELYAQYIEPLKRQLAEILASKNDREVRLQQVIHSSLMGPSSLDTADSLKRSLNRMSELEMNRLLMTVIDKTPLSNRLAQRCWILEAFLGVVMDKAHSSGGDIKAIRRVLQLLSDSLEAIIKNDDFLSHIRMMANSLAKQTLRARNDPSGHTEKMLAWAVEDCVKEGGCGGSTLKSMKSIHTFLEKESRDKSMVTTVTSNAGAELEMKIKEAAYVLEDQDYVVSVVVISEVEVKVLLQDSVGRKVFQETLVGLAQGRLRSLMGSAYANVVINCLRAVEDGFKNSSSTNPFDFSEPGQETAACLLLEKAVVAPLRRVNLGV